MSHDRLLVTRMKASSPSPEQPGAKVFCLDVRALTHTPGALRATVFLPITPEEGAVDQLKHSVEHVCRSMVGMLDCRHGTPAFLMTVPRRQNRRRKRTRYLRRASQALQVIVATTMLMWIGSGALEWAFNPIRPAFL